MCGICGRFGFDGAPGDPELIRRMAGRLVHRGPDDQGVHVGPSIALGERRLAVIDLSPAAAAPLSNEDGSVWVVFNGEIYNFRELRADLERRGHAFRTATDTEILVHLWEEDGPRCVRRLRGMFAFAIWDAPRRVLFCARDRLGKKPFYYAHDVRRITFASSVGALLEDPSIRRLPDYGAIDAYLTSQYVPSPATAFADVRKLPAAHTLTCTADGAVAVERYWEPATDGEVERQPAELRDELLHRLREAVRMRLVSDVPLGAFLSGGIDSSVVVALMAEAGPVRTFTIGSPVATSDERPYARMVAERYGTEHHEFVVEPESLDVIPELVRHYGEPFADSSAVPTYYVAKLARQHVTVALSGDGGDESFSGYDRYAEVARWGAADRIPRPLRRAVASTLRTVVGGTDPAGLGARVERAGAMLAAGTAERYRLHVSILKPQEKRALYLPDFRERVRGAQPGRNGNGAGPPDPIRWMMWHDLQHYLPDCLMVKTDVASMAHSLEVRCPLLDHELVDFMATVPRRHLRNATGGKQLLRDVARPLLPQALFERPKMGFGVPLHAWFRESFGDYLRDVLLDERARRRGMFDSAAVERMMGQHAAGGRDWSSRLWSLLMLELWYREFID